MSFCKAKARPFDVLHHPSNEHVQTYMYVWDMTMNYQIYCIAVVTLMTYLHLYTLYTLSNNIVAFFENGCIVVGLYLGTAR